MADTPLPQQPIPAASPSASQLCARCGLTYRSGDNHTCSAAASRPEFVETQAPGGPEEVDSLSATATPDPTTAPPGLAPDVLIGTLINDRFEVQKLLGRGGMGAVYQARHRALDTQVAIKVLLQQGGPQEHERFLLEAKIASKVRHPNTVYISDFGHLADGRNYLAMEFLKGRPLADEVDKGPMPALRALRIAVQIARGLRAVHDSGIAHRDIKPANVLLVEQDGNPDFVKIVDFGIAKVLAGDTGSFSPLDAARAKGPDATDSSGAGAAGGAAPDAPGAQAASLTQTGAVMGTPAYMSPEQVRGRHIDGRTDQYAFGCMFYQMLTGRIPFSGKSAIEVMLQHSDLQAKPLPPRQRLPGLQISDTLEQLVLRLLAKEPDARFPSMAAVEQALEHELDLILIARGEKRLLTAEHVAALDGRLRESAVVPPPPLRPARLWLAAAGILLFFLGAAAILYRQLHKPEKPRLRPGELAQLRAQALTVLHMQLEPAAPMAVRLEALAALGQSGDGSVSQELLPLLKDRDPQVQSQAAAALGQLAEPSTAAVLQGVLAQTPPPLLQVAAAGALLQLRDPEGQRQLVQALSAADSEVQFSAAMLLCEETMVPQAQALLRRYVQAAPTPEPIRQNILACLSESGDAQARQQLIERARGAGLERLNAAGRLLQLGEEAGRTVLQRAVRQGGPEGLLAARWLSGPAARWRSGPDEQKSVELLAQVAADASANPAARQLAAQGLGDSGDTFHARLLGGLLRAEQPERLRTAAAGAIVRLAAQEPGTLGENSLHWAQGALTDRSWLIRQTAVSVLADTPSADAVAVLARLIKDSDPRLRRSAAQALGHRHEPAVLAVLHDSLSDSDPGVRQAAIRSLGRILAAQPAPVSAEQKAEAVAWLRTLFDHAPPPEQALVSSILSQLGDPEHRAKLLALATSADPEQRRRFIESKLAGPEDLVRALQDKEPAVRLGAAKQLVARGDHRAAQPLRELAGGGGVEGIVAYGLLRQLGEKTAEPADLEQLLIVRDVDKRLAAVGALSYLPPDAALPLLSQTAHDPDPRVRSRVAVVAAGFPRPAGSAVATVVLSLLLTDHDAAVRARAQALLAHAADAAEPPEESDFIDQETAAAAPPAAGSASAAGPEKEEKEEAEKAPEPGAAAPGSGAGTATLIFEAEPGILYQLDHRGFQLTGPQPVRVTPGPHHISAMGSQQDFVVKPEQSLTLRLAISRVERLAHAAEESFNRRDYRKAQRQLDQAISLCTQDRQNAVLCAILSVDLIFRLGQIREQQLEWPEAMNEYQRVTTLFHKVKGKPELKARVAEAMTRLRPRVCKVVVRQPVRRRCVEEIVWVPPGPRIIKVGGKLERILARTDEDIQVGTCN